MKPNMHPGIMKDTIQSITSNTSLECVKLAVDDKKISRGKGKILPDIDSWNMRGKTQI